MASHLDEQQGLLTGTLADVEAVPEDSNQVEVAPRTSATRLRVGGVVLLCLGFVALGAVAASNYSPAHADATSSTNDMTVLMYPFKGGKGNATLPGSRSSPCATVPPAPPKPSSPCATVAPALPKPTKPPKPTKKPTTTPLPTSTPPPTPKPVKASPCATVAPPKPVTPKPAPASPCATAAPAPVTPASPCATAAPGGLTSGTTASTSKAASSGTNTMNINIPYTTNNAPALSGSSADPALQSGIQKAIPAATSASVDTKSTSGGRLLQAGMATVWVKFTIVLSVLMDPVALLDLLVKQVKIIVQTTNAMLGSIEVDAIVDITKAIGVWGPTGQYFSRSPSLPSPMPEPEPEPEAEVPP